MALAFSQAILSGVREAGPEIAAEIARVANAMAATVRPIIRVSPQIDRAAIDGIHADIGIE
jgi:hypothetical protein